MNFRAGMLAAVLLALIVAVSGMPSHADASGTDRSAAAAKKKKKCKKGKKCKKKRKQVTPVPTPTPSPPTPPTPPPPPAPAPGELVINELFAAPSGAEGDANGDGTTSVTADEFVEIYNGAAGPRDLSTITISDGTTRHVFPAGTVLPTNCAALVFGGPTATGIFGGAVTSVASTGGLSLNNAGDTVALALGATTLDSVTYATATNNESFTRSPDGSTTTMVLHTEAAGSMGGFSPGRTASGTAFAGCAP